MSDFRFGLGVKVKIERIGRIGTVIAQHRYRGGLTTTYDSYTVSAVMSDDLIDLDYAEYELINLNAKVEAAPITAAITNETAPAAHVVETTNIEASEPSYINALTNEDVDVNGMPWSEEIHSANRSKNKDGTWRGKRGLGPQAPDAGLPALPAVPVGLPGLVAPPSTAPVSMADLIALYTDAVARGVMDPEKMTTLYVKHGTNATDLATNETARAAIAADLK